MAAQKARGKIEELGYGQQSGMAWNTPYAVVQLEDGRIAWWWVGSTKSASAEMRARRLRVGDPVAGFVYANKWYGLTLRRVMVNG